MEQLDNDKYMELHHTLIHQPTRRERIQQQKDMLLHDQYQSYSSKEIQQQQQACIKKEIRIPFTFESGPMLDFQCELRRLWNKYYIYNGSPMKDVSLTIVTRINKSLSQLLIQKKPPKSMLINVDSTNIQQIKSITNA
jgi:hypothetical protein